MQAKLMYSIIAEGPLLPVLSKDTMEQFFAMVRQEQEKPFQCLEALQIMNIEGLFQGHYH